MSGFFSDKKRVAAYAMMIGVFIIIGIFAPRESLGYWDFMEYVDAGEELPAELVVNFGGWTLLVPIVMFAFVLLTKSFLEAFIWASFMTVFMRFRGDTIVAFTNEQINAVLDYDNARMLILYLGIGAVLAAVSKGGGAKAFADWARSKAKSPKTSLIIMWLMDIVLSVDDELSAFTTGAAITPLADSYGIPREKSAFMIRCSAVAPATLWPLGAWTVFVAVLLETSGFAESGQGVTAYMKCVPFMFFPMIVLVIGLLVALGIIPDFGKMKAAVKRVQEGGPIAPDASGKEMGDDAGVGSGDINEGMPRRMINFFLPVIALVGGAWVAELDIMVGVICSLVVTYFLFVFQGICTPKQFINDILVEGFKDMMMLAMLFGVSLVLVNELDAMGFAPFIVDATSKVLSAKLLPFVIFTVFACTEFLVSFNWSLYMMALPIVIPLASATGANPYMTIAALICAGIWGSQGCLYSDGAIVAAAATGTDAYESSTTSVQYIVVAAVLTAVCFLVAGFVF